MYERYVELCTVAVWIISIWLVWETWGDGE